MPTIDLAEEAKKLGVEIDESDPRGSMERVFEAIAKQRDEAVEAQGTTDARLERVMSAVEAGIDATGAKKRNDELATGQGIEGRGEIEVADPEALKAAQEEAGLDPDRSEIMKDGLARAKSVPEIGFGPNMFRADFRREHPIHQQEAQDETQLAMQLWNDDLYLMSRIFDVPVQQLGLWHDVMERSAAVCEMVNKTPRAHWVGAGNAKLKLGTPEHERTATDALVSDSASAGGDWVPVGMSAQIFFDTRVRTVLAQQLTQVNMTSLTFQNPFLSGEPTTYLTTQATDQVPKAFDTGTPTLTAKGFGTAMEFSSEMEEDSLAAVLPIVRESLVNDQADSLESALINGDDSGSHFDGAAVDGGSGDVRNAWDGFRLMTFDGSLTTDLNTLNVENLRNLTSNMGKYAQDPGSVFWLTGLKIRVKLLSLRDNQNNRAVLTLSELGPNATILTGQIAEIDGSPVLVSGQYPEFEDSTGVYGDSGGTPSAYTQSSIILIHPRMFHLGNRRPMRIEQDRLVLADYTLVVAKSRWGFVPAIALNATYPAAWRGINMDTV